MTSICDICGKPRGGKGHELCSKKRKAKGFPNKRVISEAQRLTIGKRNARRHAKGLSYIPSED